VINRRLAGDIHYVHYPERFSTCTDIDSSNVTYLVEERLCVTSNDLQKGKLKDRHNIIIIIMVALMIVYYYCNYNNHRMQFYDNP
jgi:hypothetical protein